jgi:hypothetical protein
MFFSCCTNQEVECPVIFKDLKKDTCPMFLVLGYHRLRESRLKLG